VTPVQQFSGRVWRRWAVVVLLAVVGTVAAAVWSVTSATSVWTGTAALTTQSQNRSPDQDAVLALGYVDYFNTDAYQEQLRSEIDVPAEVTLSATTAATSPVFYIMATGRSADEVRAAAAAATERYRADIRDSLVAERQQSVADLQALIDQNVQLAQAPERTEAERNVIFDQIRSLQGRLTDLQADNTNLVKQLQPEPATAESTPNPTIDIVAGALGGAVLGVLLATLLAMLDRRLHTRHDLRQRLGLETLADLTGRHRDPESRTRRLANLANALDLDGPVPGPGEPGRTVAVVSARTSARSAELARSLAGALAERRQALRTVDGFRVLPADGPASDGNGAGSVQAAWFDQLVAQPAGPGPIAVIDAPPLLEAAESQSACAAADRVLLVVERGRSRVADVREALELLGAVRAPVVGAVLVHPLAGDPNTAEGSVGPAANDDGGAAEPRTPSDPQPVGRGPAADPGRANGRA
jgi:capsular polysaccharide biosynthesis protein